MGQTMKEPTPSNTTLEPVHPAPLILGVIMARGGSRGLTDKHTRPLLGKPVIHYTLQHAQASAHLSHVIVSTDSIDIATIAKTTEIATLDRPAELCIDTASVQAVMLHALSHVERASNVMFDAAVILYGNVAVRGADVIDRCIQHWQLTRCDSVRTFCPVGKWHPAWMSRLNDDAVEPLRPGSIHRRQDLEPLFLHDGACVVMSRASLLRGEQTPDDPHAMFGVNRRGIITQPDDTVEIDTLRDLYWAEAVLRLRQALQEDQA
jgi:CMP-N,N'-diacetyllegionaminic acid synthase